MFETGLEDVHATPVGVHWYKVNSDITNSPVPSMSASAQCILLSAKTSQNYGKIFFLVRNTFDLYMQNVENGIWSAWKKITFAEI